MTATAVWSASRHGKTGARALNRFQQFNAVKISGVAIRPLDEALRFLEDEAAKILPKGYKLDYTGESRQLRTEGNKFLPAFVLAIALIFLVLAAQFNSFRDPFVVLLSVPLSIFGAVVPWGTVWRTGANAATQFRTDRDLLFGALTVPAAFFVGRYLARGWVVKQIEANPRFKAIDEAVAGEGWKIVGLTRLSPAFPFNLLNYAFGVTRVSPRDYILASWIGWPAFSPM